jgi:hypothetical protein
VRHCARAVGSWPLREVSVKLAYPVVLDAENRDITSMTAVPIPSPTDSISYGLPFLNHVVL